MDKDKNIIILTIENGILTADDNYDGFDRDGSVIRLVNKELGEGKEMKFNDELACRRFFESLHNWLLEYEVKIICWASEKAFNCKKPRSIMLLMVYGYIISPDLYPIGLAAKYDAYIRKNTAKLFKASLHIHDLNDATTLINHIFAICNPTKTAITSALAKISILYDSEGDNSKEVEKLNKALIDHLKRLYPRFAKKYLAIKAARSVIRMEAVKRMELLKLSDETILLFKKGFLRVSDQIALGKDPDYIKGSDDIILKSFSSRYDGKICLSSGGVVWSLQDRMPNPEQLRLVNEAEKKYQEFGAMVYHIHRCKVNEDMVLLAFLVVLDNEDGGGGWEHAREMATMGLPDCIAPVFGYDGAFEYSSLPIALSAPSNGCLLRIN